MLNDQDINKLKSVFATKEDLEKFATKKDLENFATKQDLERFATKSDFLELKRDVEGLRESMQGMITAVDNLAKVISDLRSEYVAITYQLDRHELWIKQIAEKVGLKLAME